jgi:hypothetical protein
MRQDAEQRWSTDAIAKRLGIAPTVAETVLVELCSSGLLSVNVGADLTYQFSPASPALNTSVEEFVTAFREHRIRVYELVVLGGPLSACDFANAFRLRRGGEDGDDG